MTPEGRDPQRKPEPGMRVAQPKSQNTGCLILVAVLVAVGTVIVLNLPKTDTSPGSARRGEHGKGSADVYCQKYVKARLKAPSTAEFPWIGAGHHIHELGGGRYRVDSHVDAQNTFGAQIRHDYVCVVNCTEGLGCVLESLTIGGQKFR